jgi:hypothetical protein
MTMVVEGLMIWRETLLGVVVGSRVVLWVWWRAWTCLYT